MIKNLFFPERIGSYFLLKKKTVGVHITESAIYATVVIANGNTVSIESTHKVPITQPSQIVTALSKIIGRIKNYSALITTIDSSLVIFKELTIPIIGEEKIALILNFELEPYLPFPIEQANIDFIITKEDKVAKTTSILVTAIQKNHIADHVGLFSKANLSLDAITVDLINVFGLYQKITPSNKKQNTTLVVIDDAKTHIAYLKNGSIKKIRTINKNIVTDEAALQQAIFTLDSFIQEEGPIQKIHLMGNVPRSFLTVIKDAIDIPCDIFKLEAALKSINITMPTVDEPLNLLSTAAAYPSSLSADFNLLMDESTANQQKRFNAQFITGTLLSIAIIASLSIHTFIEVKNLSSIAEKAKSRTLADLKKNFSGLKGNSLKETIKNAKKQIQKEEEMWFSFSSQTQHSFLKYLLDLSTKVDREVLGLGLKKMVISKGTISLDGNVRNFEAIDEFEKQLKETQLFSDVPLLQQTSFSPLVLPIATKGDLS
jgi:hypothetical protein